MPRIVDFGDNAPAASATSQAPVAPEPTQELVPVVQEPCTTAVAIAELTVPAVTVTQPSLQETAIVVDDHE